jgi:peptide/nickel transport system permease protein
MKLFKKIKRNYLAILGIVILGFIFCGGLLAPWLAPHNPNKCILPNRFQGRSADYPLGTDELGRCMLSRLLYGARLSFVTGLGTVLMSAIVGIPLGLIAGYYGGWLESFLMRAMDVLLSVPYFLLALSIVAILGPGLLNSMIAIAVWTLPGYVRITRACVLEIREKEYIESAKAIGHKDSIILLKHVLPNCFPTLIVQTSLRVGAAIVSVAALSFLGLGAQPPTAEWGAMLNSGRSYIRTAPHIVMYPGLAIFISVLGFNLVGDGLRDILDPWRKRT